MLTTILHLLMDERDDTQSAANNPGKDRWLTLITEMLAVLVWQTASTGV